MLKKGFVAIVLVMLGVFAIACGTETATQPAANTVEETVQVVSPQAVTSAKVVEVEAPPKAVVAEVIEAGIPVEEESVPEVQAAVEVDTERVVEVEPAVVVEVEPEAEPFTAEIGLDTLSRYQLNFAMSFDGTNKGKPNAGSMSGLLESTKKPAAKHWQVSVDGPTFTQMIPLDMLELYDIKNTIYVQNPQDKTWIGMPSFLVDSMMPEDMGNPEESIDLPLTAVRHAGEESINGIVTERYSFGADDVANGSQYEAVSGTIWVAKEGNFVVKYEAEFSGHHDNLAAGGIELIDEGTITMTYELAHVDDPDFVINPPAKAKAIDLTKLFF